MCKLLCITGPLTESAALSVVEVTNAIYGKTQPDGFGFVADGMADGKPATAYGRYLMPDRFCTWKAPIPHFFNGPQEEIGTFPTTTNVLLCHGRISTNVKTLINVHPFYTQGTYLAHNGILEWSGSKETTPPSVAGCDSEEFLNWYVSDPTSAVLPALLKGAWSGFGAIFILTEGKLRLIKDGTASLFGAKRAKGGWVWVTDKDNGERICEATGVALITRFMKVPPVICEFDSSGDPINDVSWTGFASRVWDAKASSSYGWHRDGAGTFHQVKADKTGPIKPLTKKQRKALDREFNKRVRTEAKAVKGEMFPDWDGGSTSLPVNKALTYNDLDLLDNATLTEL